MIKAVIFDVDGVLLDSFEANFIFCRELFIEIGYKPPDREALSKLFHLSLMDVIKKVTGLNNENELKKIWLIGKNKVIQNPIESSVIPSNLKKVLDQLKEKYLLAVVTSRVSGALFKLAQLSSYESYFKTAIYFEDTVKHKPDPEPLLLAVKRLGIKPSESVYIGDMESDIKAAKAAGMKVIIYSKENLPGADAITSSFDNLPNLIKSLN